MEQGSHEELLKIRDGVYSNLINMQSGREEEESKEGGMQGGAVPGKKCWLV